MSGKQSITKRLRIRPGGGRGCRTTVRHACASTSMTGYRNMVDVDLVGRFDPPDQYTRIANVTWPCHNKEAEHIQTDES